jgi:hypothetical protein
MAPEDFIRLEMPPERRSLSVSQLLDRTFPSCAEERQAISAQFDLRGNPDLPDIYAVFLAVCDEWRDWRCALRVTSTDGADVDLTAPVSGLLTTDTDLPLTALRLEQRYCALEYAVRRGFSSSRRELLDWMRSLTALYFIDKHEVLLRPGSLPESAPALREALASLLAQGLIAVSPSTEPDDDGRSDVASDAPPCALTPLGRRFIGGLLVETESLIDQYDHYKDTVVDVDREMAEFDTGRGVDLRVEAFLADGLDPIRAVFLLRLYDGAFDHRLRDWQDAIEGEEFYEGILEPVVNRHGATPEAMEAVIESGLSWLEEQQEQARREAAERDILRRAENDL